MERFRLLQPYFGHLSCPPFMCMKCEVQGVRTYMQFEPECTSEASLVYYISSRSAYNLNQSVVQELPSFVKLVSPFRKQHF